jgi:hypothetical protein
MMNQAIARHEAVIGALNLAKTRTARAGVNCLIALKPQADETCIVELLDAPDEGSVRTVFRRQTSTGLLEHLVFHMTRQFVGFGKYLPVLERRNDASMEFVEVANLSTLQPLDGGVRIAFKLN